MELIQIHPVGFIWGMLFVLWLGFCSAYMHKDEARSVVKVLGFFLLATGVLLLGISIGSEL
jgi:hypothetical protein